MMNEKVKKALTTAGLLFGAFGVGYLVAEYVPKKNLVLDLASSTYPGRSVDIAIHRPGRKIIMAYALTKEQAFELAKNLTKFAEQVTN